MYSICIPNVWNYRVRQHPECRVGKKSIFLGDENTLNSPDNGAGTIKYLSQDSARAYAMNFLFVLLSLNLSTSSWIIISSGAVFLILTLFFFRRSRKSPQQVPPIETEAEATQAIPAEEVQIITSEYTVDKDDRNLFKSNLTPELAVRFVWGTYETGYRQKDTAEVSTSLPYSLSDNDIELWTAEVPEITSISRKSNHSIVVIKSPAASQEQVMNKSVTFLFTHLEQLYGWKNKKQVVFVQLVNESKLNFTLRVCTKHHVALGRKLVAIEGIIGEHEGLPLLMEHNSNYDFNLGKAKTFTWPELFPEIRKVFEEHFIAGVTFTGYSGPSSEESWFMKVDDGD